MAFLMTKIDLDTITNLQPTMQKFSQNCILQCFCLYQYQ